jgi:hypothetical protein
VAVRWLAALYGYEKLNAEAAEGAEETRRRPFK